MKKTDSIKRLNNLCDFIEEQRNNSPYSQESWHKLIEENNSLITKHAILSKEHTTLIKIHELCASELWNANKKLASLEKK
jgi:hypothetical protein